MTVSLKHTHKPLDRGSHTSEEVNTAGRAAGICIVLEGKIAMLLVQICVILALI